MSYCRVNRELVHHYWDSEFILYYRWVS